MADCLAVVMVGTMVVGLASSRAARWAAQTDGYWAACLAARTAEGWVDTKGKTKAEPTAAHWAGYSVGQTVDSTVDSTAAR